MTTFEISMPCTVMHSSFANHPEIAPARERMAVVGVVVLLHLLVFASYLLQPEAPAVMVNEMSISFANMQMQQADVVPQPKPEPRKVEPEPLPAEEPVVKEVVAPAPVPQAAATPPSPVQLDSEPDYKATYLNNPRPPYPLAAQRMGYQGKVVLNVEVLAEGRAGEVKLETSSGHDLLDNAAMQTVKTWRFVPARRFGQAVTQWFLVPIKYSLGDNAA